MSRADVAAAVAAITGDAAAGAADEPVGAAPRSEAQFAALLRTTAEHGWRVAVGGNASWRRDRPAADLHLTTSRLDAVHAADAGDLVATVGAGLRWADLQHTLGAQGAWVALDPPGTERTVGSVVATGTAGALHTGYGAVRDHLLGLTLVTGDGRILAVGGRVVKNVAGFDLTRLACGSWGAFGVITSVTLRLRARPTAECTGRVEGSWHDVEEQALRLLDAGLMPHALELRREAGEAAWTLRVRALGTETGVDAARGTLAEVSPDLAFATADGSADQWHTTGPADDAVVLRVGALPTQCGAVVEHLDAAAPGGRVAVHPAAGWIRWEGHADADTVRRLRESAAALGVPLTVERAPAAVLDALGHTGALPSGTGPLVDGIRALFDPSGVLAAPLEVG